MGDNMDPMLAITLAINGLSTSIAFYSYILAPRIKDNKMEKQCKFNIDELNKYDGYLINKECFLDNGSLADKKDAMNRKKIEIIYPYVEVLAKQIPEEELKLMYTNLKTLEVKKKSRIFILLYSGAYYFYENKIRYVLEESLGHELLHLCSSYYNKELGISECGFEQQRILNLKGTKPSKYFFIGRGITEGYTELLSSRFFKGDYLAYAKYVQIVRLLELFFDNSRDMEKLYFRHDLSGLVNYLSKFIPYKRVIDIIVTLDNALIREKKNQEKFIPDFTDIKTELYGYFKSANMNSQKLELFESILENDDLDTNISLYRDSFTSNEEFMNLENDENKDNRIKIA